MNNEQKLQIRIYRSNFEQEIELLMSTVIRYKYYGHSEMSIKFKYRYIEKLPTITQNEIIADT